MCMEDAGSSIVESMKSQKEQFLLIKYKLLYAYSKSQFYEI